MSTDVNSPGIFPASLQTEFDQALHQLKQDNVLARLWQHDFTLWASTPKEIENRLGWLHLPETMQDDIADIEAFVQQVQAEGFTSTLLLGMGGSSLAPEVFAKMFGTRAGYLDLHILDSTDPGAVRHYQDILELDKTLFIVATKSGGTVETLSFTKYFYNLLADKHGAAQAGMHFAAITDPGSKLEKLSQDLGFRKCFLNDPDLGGRYSALSHFGLVPAALLGVNLPDLLAESRQAAAENGENTVPTASFAARLGALIGAGALQGLDKVTFLSDGFIAPFGDWVEQLIAESTGKSGKGILPVIGEAPAEDLSTYSSDRIFVYQHAKGSSDLEKTAQDLKALGHPVVEYQMASAYDLGRWMLIWEIATAVAGHILQIHPFDQPNVEAAKILARNSVQTYQDSGKLPEQENQPLTFEAIDGLLSTAKPGDYISLQAYVTPNDANEYAFRGLQTALRDRYHLAVTFGFGPRFLHSTGQLHKGDGGNGIFLQFTSHGSQDLPIPDNPGDAKSFISFGVLKQAQAMGDAQALKEADRRLLTFSLEEPAGPVIAELTRKVAA